MAIVNSYVSLPEGKQMIFAVKWLVFQCAIVESHRLQRRGAGRCSPKDTQRTSLETAFKHFPILPICMFYQKVSQSQRLFPILLSVSSLLSLSIFINGYSIRLSKKTLPELPFGKLRVCYGKSPFSMGESTISPWLQQLTVENYHLG